MQQRPVTPDDPAECEQTRPQVDVGQRQRFDMSSSEGMQQGTLRIKRRNPYPKSISVQLWQDVR